MKITLTTLAVTALLLTAFACTNPEPLPTAPASAPDSAAAAPQDETPEDTADKKAPLEEAPAGNCQRDRGCPNTEALSACVGSKDPMTVKELLDRKGKLAGKTVQVTGKLVAPASCTKKGCPPSAPCCNRCFGALYVGGDDGRVALKDSKDDGRFACEGDDSMVCCAFAPGDKQVMVTGELVDEKGELSIVDPTVCGL